MKKSRRTYNGVHLNKKSNTQDVVEQSLTKNGNQTTDIYFYTDDSNPYKNMKLDMDALKQYNRFIYPLSLFLDRIL